MAYPRRYAATHAAAIGNPITVGALVSTAAIRPACYDFQIGFAAPADLSIEWIIQRVTSVTAGSNNSTVVAAPLDSLDPAALTTTGQLFTIEPTKTAATELIDEELNQRASYRWVAAPGGELAMPATANAGLGVICIHASGTPTCRATWHFTE